MYLRAHVKGFWVRLNYATTHHDPPPSTTIHHHQPPAKIYPPAPTSTHHQPKYIYHHTPPPKKWIKIYSYITSFWHCFNSFFFYEIQYSIPWQRFCMIKFWSVCFSNSKFLLHFTILKIFLSLHYKSLRLQDLLFVFINKIVILTSTRRVSNQKGPIIIFIGSSVVI